MFLTFVQFSFNTYVTNPEFSQMVKWANITSAFGKAKIYL